MGAANLIHFHPEMMMQDHKPEDQTAIRTDLGAIFVSLELSRSTWLVTSLCGWRGEDVKNGTPVDIAISYLSKTERCERIKAEVLELLRCQLSELHRAPSVEAPA